MASGILVLLVSGLLGWIIVRGSRRIAQRWLEIASEAGAGPAPSQRRMLQTAGWVLPLAIPATLLGILLWKSRGTGKP